MRLAKDSSPLQHGTERLQREEPSGGGAQKRDRNIITHEMFVINPASIFFFLFILVPKITGAYVLRFLERIFLFDGKRNVIPGGSLDN